jgi:hypothetical protein
MTNQVIELLETRQITEPEIVDLLNSYHRLVQAKFFKQEDFDKVLQKLGITQEGNVFTFNDEMSYTFN